MTHACCLDGVCDLCEQLLVLGGILASDKYLDRVSTAFYLIEVFGCLNVSVGQRMRGY